MSMSHHRISQLRRILEEVGLHKLETETVCNAILKNSTKSNKLSKNGFDSAMEKVLELSTKKKQSESYTKLSS